MAVTVGTGDEKKRGLTRGGGSTATCQNGWRTSWNERRQAQKWEAATAFQGLGSRKRKRGRGIEAKPLDSSARAVIIALLGDKGLLGSELARCKTDASVKNGLTRVVPGSPKNGFERMWGLFESNRAGLIRDAMTRGQPEKNGGRLQEAWSEVGGTYKVWQVDCHLVFRRLGCLQQPY